MPTDPSIPFVPESRSDILNSTHILRVTAGSVTLGPWVREPGRFQRRTADCVFTFEEKWKGRVEEPSGTQINLTVSQWECAVPRLVAVPGAWSGELLEAGARLVVFCNSGATRLAELLAEPACRKVEAADAALPDFALVSRAGSPPAPLAALVDRTFADRGRFGYLIAQYLAARLPECLFQRREDFEALLRLVGDAGLADRARWILLTDLYSQFLLRDPAPADWVERLLTVTFRTLALPEGAALRTPLLGTYIPNLLGLEGGADRKQASEVFAGKPDERQAAESFLNGQLDQPGAHAVLEWIRASG